MRHLEVCIKCNESLYDILIAELEEIGYSSFWEDEACLKSYIEPENYNEETLNSICEKYSKSKKIKFSVSTLENKNWNEEWEKSYNPVFIDSKYVIAAPFHNGLDSNLKSFIISPKMAFGTGHHNTTELMIKLQDQIEFGDKSVLDFGCGTGILSIFAEYKHAKNIIAIDIEEEAIDSTKENIQYNNCKKIDVLQCSIEDLDLHEYDIILANITKNILIQSAVEFEKRLKENGLLLVSGIFEEDMESISSSFTKHNINLIEYLKKDDWVACKYMKK